MKARRSSKHSRTRRLVRPRPAKNIVWWMRFSIASFIAFFVVSVVLHPTSYVVGYDQAYALVSSLFGGIRAQFASWLVIAALCLWMIGWGFLWYGRNNLNKRHTKIVNVASWAVPSAIIYMWVAGVAGAMVGMSISNIAAIAFMPPLIIGCAVPLLFAWPLQNSGERVLSMFTFLAGIFIICLWAEASVMVSVLSPFVEILFPVYLGLLSTTYLLTFLRIISR